MEQRLVRPGTWQSFSPIRREGTRHTHLRRLNRIRSNEYLVCTGALCGWVLLLRQKCSKSGLSLSSIEIRMNEPTAPALNRHTRNHSTRGAAVRKIHEKRLSGETRRKVLYSTVTRTRGRVGRDNGRYSI